MSWTIEAKTLTGKAITVQVPNPENSTVLDLKKLIFQKDVSVPTHLQRLVLQANRMKLEEHKRLTEVGLSDNAQLLLIVTTPFELYVQDMNGKKHTVEIPSVEPEKYLVAKLRALIEAKVGCSLDEYSILFERQPVQTVKNGKHLTLQDWSIKAESTLILFKTGYTLNITNPKVDACFMVDCTWSMKDHIVAVKDIVQKLRDQLAREFKGCDLRFSFVRYTDHDLSEDTMPRTTMLDFTRDQREFQYFVSKINAHEARGADTPEDIMGALKVTFKNLSWRPDCDKVLIHIADAPCHGTEYHTGGGRWDSFPDGDPTGISHESMMAEVVRLDVQYWFGYIHKSLTDKMIEVFNESLQRQSDQRLLIRQFDAVNPTAISEAIQRNVSVSVIGSAAARHTAEH